MATQYQARISYGIPVKYNCSKCGKENITTIPLTGTASKNIPDLTSRSRKEEIINGLKYSAYSELGREVRYRYGGDPVVWGAEMRAQKCAACGSSEKWMKGKKTSIAKIVGALLGIALFLAGPIMAAVMDSLIMIIVVPVVGLVVLAVGEKIINNVNGSKKEAEKRKEWEEIQEKCKPTYVVSLEEALAETGKKYQASLDEE